MCMYQGWAKAEEKRVTKKERDRIKIAAVMIDVPPIPSDLEQWAVKNALGESKYIFYKKIKTKVHGLCSVCGQLVYPEIAYHGRKGKCPGCGEKITYKAINKAKYYKDEQIVTVLQRMLDGNHVIRYFKVSLEFKWGQNTNNFPASVLETLRNPVFDMYEGSREVLSYKADGKLVLDYYETQWNYSEKKMEWIYERARSVFNQKELLREAAWPYVYKRNFRRVLNKSPWKYSGIDYLKVQRFNISDLILTWNRYPHIEMLAKANYTELLFDVSGFNNGRYYSTCLNLCDKMFGVSKQTLKTGMRLGFNAYGLDFLDRLELKGIYMTDEQLMWVKHCKNQRMFLNLLDYAGPQKIINYITKQDDGRIENTLHEWNDYLGMCRKLELDLKSDFVLFPRELKERHDEYAVLVAEKEMKEAAAAEAKEEREIDLGVREQHRIWKESLEYKAGKHQLRVAGDRMSIIRHGQALRQCVGSKGYAKRMAKGDRLILFVLKNGSPYSTIDFDARTYEIRQHTAYKNEKVDKGTLRFIEQWKNQRIMPLVRTKQAV